jgi:hypothetical protein
LTAASAANTAPTAAQAAALGAEDFVLLGSVTPDGLTAAWATLVAGVTSVVIADRASPTDPFGAPSRVAAADGVAAFGRVALDAAGQRLVVIDAERRAFRALARPARGADFARAAGDDLAELNASIAQLDLDRRVGDPALSPDGTAFVYTVFGGTRDAVLHESLRTPSGFAAGAPHPELATTPGARIAATGVAADGKALFFVDTGASEQKVAYRGSAQEAGAPAPFTFVHALGQISGAQPSADCAQLFFAVPTAAGMGATLVTAPFAL